MTTLWARPGDTLHHEMAGEWVYDSRDGDLYVLSKFRDGACIATMCIDELDGWDVIYRPGGAEA